MPTFYAYTVSDPVELGGQVFYVGKGMAPRLRVYLNPQSALGSFLNSALKDRLRTIYDQGMMPVVTPVFESESEQAAYDEEYRLILEYGGQLINKRRLRSLSDLRVCRHSIHHPS